MAKDEEREGHTRALLSFFVRNNIEMDARANSPVSQQLFSVGSLDENEEKNEGKNMLISVSKKYFFVKIVGIHEIFQKHCLNI